MPTFFTVYFWMLQVMTYANIMRIVCVYCEAEKAIVRNQQEHPKSPSLKIRREIIITACNGFSKNHSDPKNHWLHWSVYQQHSILFILNPLDTIDSFYSFGKGNNGANNMIILLLLALPIVFWQTDQNSHNGHLTKWNKKGMQKSLHYKIENPGDTIWP